jgi:hypothetical protein
MLSHQNQLFKLKRVPGNVLVRPEIESNRVLKM